MSLLILAPIVHALTHLVHVICRFSDEREVILIFGARNILRRRAGLKQLRSSDKGHFAVSAGDLVALGIKTEHLLAAHLSLMRDRRSFHWRPNYQGKRRRSTEGAQGTNTGHEDGEAMASVGVRLTAQLGARFLALQRIVVF